jgi:hypothetical protein
MLSPVVEDSKTTYDTLELEYDNFGGGQHIHDLSNRNRNRNRNRNHFNCLFSTESTKRTIPGMNLADFFHRTVHLN